MKSWEDIYDIIWKKSDNAFDKMIEKVAIGYSLMGEDYIWNVAVLGRNDDNSIFAVVKHVSDNELIYSFETLDFTECKDKELKELYDIAGYVIVDDITWEIIFED